MSTATQKWCPQAFMYEERPGCFLYYGVECAALVPTAMYHTNATHPLGCNCTPPSLTHPACSAVKPSTVCRSSFKVSFGKPGPYPPLGQQDGFPWDGERGQPPLLIQELQRQDVLVRYQKQDGTQDEFPARLFVVRVVGTTNETSQPLVLQRGYELGSAPEPGVPVLVADQTIADSYILVTWNAAECVVLRPPWNVPQTESP